MQNFMTNTLTVDDVVKSDTKLTDKVIQLDNPHVQIKALNTPKVKTTIDCKQ